MIRSLFRRAATPLWPFFVVPVGIVAGAALSVVPPALVGRMIDALQRRDFHAAIAQLVSYIAVSLTAALVGMGSSFAARYQREVMTRNLRLSLLEKLNRARFESLSNFTVGEIGNRVLGDVANLGAQIELSLIPVVSSACMLIATVVAMARIDLRLGAIAFLTSLCTFLPQMCARERFRKLQDETSREGDRLYGAVAEAGSIQAIAMLRNATAARRLGKRLEAITGTLQRLGLKQFKLSGAVSLGATLTGFAAPAAILAFGAYLVSRGDLTAGAIVSLLIYQSRISGPLGSISGLQIILATLGVTAKRVSELADLPEEQSGDALFVPGRIALNGVTLTRGGREVLRNVDLSLERGTHVALIGPSGGGKSSLVSLLARLTHPDRGSVFIGGRDITGFDLASLRSSLCVLAQEPLLMDATLYENLTYTSPEVDARHFSEIVRLCRVDEVVERLPRGLETEIASRGHALSGGERQRIALARGLIQNPEVVVLDEALSAVDIEMERAILDGVRKLFVDRTVIVITHRLESIRDFDRIVIVGDGVVAAQGTHEQLGWNAWYQTLTNQSLAYAP